MDPVLTDDDLPARPAPRRVPRGLLWAAALATVVLTIAVVMSFSFEDDDSDVTKLSLSNPESPLQGGETAHDLPGETIPPLSFARFDPVTRTFSSSAGSLLDYRGAPLVINFWASNCAPCIREMPAIESVSEEYSDRVSFLGIDPKGDPEDAAIELIDQTGVTYDLGRDDGSSMVTWFGIAALPTTIFVQSDGTIVDVHTGEVSADQLRRTLDEKLGL